MLLSNLNMSQPYVYAQLDNENEFRLLELFPGEFEDDLQISLHQLRLESSSNSVDSSPKLTLEDLRKTLPPGWTVHLTLQGRFLFELDRQYGPTEPSLVSWAHPTTGVVPDPMAKEQLFHSEPTYEALSHVWGDPGTGSEICVQSEKGRKTLVIRQNLDTALRHLRHRRQSRMLWIDMICINQEDALERGHQVRRMNRIYGSAKRVIVWLGPEAAGSNLAVEKLDHVGRQMEVIEGGTWKLNAPDCDRPEWARTAVALPFEDEIWEAISALVRRAWFRRVWVFQEAQLGSDASIVQCGNAITSVYTLAIGFMCAATKNIAGGLSKDLQTLLYRAGDTLLRSTDRSFFQTLLSMDHKSCSDPRDKVFGALGLAPASVSERIFPDYRQPVYAAYRSMSIAMMESSKRVEFLFACDLHTRQIQGPSWVPDFSVRRKANTTRWYMSASYASGVSSADAVLSADQCTLDVLGVECGIIESMSGNSSDDPGDVPSVLSTWVQICPAEQQYMTGESRMDAFVKTAHRNFLRERFPADFSLPTLERATSCVERMLSRAEGTIARGDFAEVRGKHFFVLDNGYIGTTTGRIRRGDVVAVMLGCPMPLLLRKHDRGHFQVIGMAYVHGLMDAESILGPLGAGWSIQIGAHSGWYGTYHLCSPSGEITTEDPRLGELPLGWTRVARARKPDDPHHFAHFEHHGEGRQINSDPRLLPDALRQRGVPLTTFSLV